MAVPINELAPLLCSTALVVKALSVD